MKKYSTTYSPIHALRWYTKESCLYELLNQALRKQDIDGIFAFRFFIRDLQIQLGQHQCLLPVHAYRGQKISNDELEILQESIGNLISVNSFFSTSLDRRKAMNFAIGSKNEGVSVLFEIDANPIRTKTKPFADISEFSVYKDEKEILFMCGSIFRLSRVQLIQDGVYSINLELCSDDDISLKNLWDYMRNQNTSWDGILAFGNLLLQMGKFDDAEKYYHLGLRELARNHVNTVYYYHGLGLVGKERGDLKSSFEWFYKSLELYKAMRNENAIASIYNNIAALNVKIGDFKEAIDSYNLALNIYNSRTEENQQNIAMCYNNLGAVYYEEKKYTDALKYYQKALELLERILPKDHHQFGGAYNNIGDVHLNLGHYVFAFEYFNLALTIKEKSLPMTHPSIAATYQSIGLTHEYSDDLKQALSYYRKAEAIYEKRFSPDHQHVKEIKQHIMRIITAMSNRESE